MGFVGELMSGKNGIEWYYIIGLILFIVLFAVVLYRTIHMSKSELWKIKTSIFEANELEDGNNNNSNN